MSPNVIIDKSQQRSRDWFAARAGCITASNFHFARKAGGLTAQQKTYVDAIRLGATPEQAMAASGYKKAPSAEGVARALRGERVGEFSVGARDYAFKLAIERISKLPLGVDENFEVWQAERGTKLEPYARIEHEEFIGGDFLVEDAGFMHTLDGKFGATADGFADLLGERIGCEYKCFLDPAKLRDILLYNDASSVLDQCDGGLWLTGLRMWHFGLYCPALGNIGMGFTLTPVARDDERIEVLEVDLLELDATVDEYVARLRQRAGLNHQAAPTAIADAAEINSDLVRASSEIPADIVG